MLKLNYNMMSFARNTNFYLFCTRIWSINIIFDERKIYDRYNTFFSKY